MKLPRIIWGTVAERFDELLAEEYNLRLANRMLIRALRIARAEVAEQREKMAEAKL